MCFVFFCFCDTCNSYSSKCVEFFIFIISFISFVISILAFFFIKRENLRFLCFVLLLVLIIFSFFIFLSICIILILRHKQTINTSQNKVAIVFSIIGLLIAIFYFICMISEISFIHAHYRDLNFPCLSNKNNGILDNYDYLTDKEIKELCSHNRNYNTYKISVKEFLIAYGFAISLIILMLSLIYSWFNEYRRIKYLIDGSLHDFSIQKNKNENNNIDDEEDEKENKKENYNNENEQENKIKNNNNNNNIIINNIHVNKNNNSENKEGKNISDSKNNQENIMIYSNKNNISLSIEGSSDIILNGNYNRKFAFKKKK